MFDKMEEPSDDENDMLDLAFGLTETSRLGCQVIMSKELDGLVVRLPSMTRNLQASDFEPQEIKPAGTLCCDVMVPTGRNQSAFKQYSEVAF